MKVSVMNNLKHCFALVALVLTSFVAQAQNRPMTGTVSEDLGGMKEPIYGANVVVVNGSNRTLTGAITDLDGNYILQVPANEKNISIQVSFIGMKTQVFKYTGQSKLDVVLESDTRQLSTVDVSAKKIDRNEMGISFKEQTSATQKIMVSDLVEAAPVSSIEEALQGQMAGVDIVMGGDPGAKSAIRIRGTSTLSSSTDPLIVIDGIPYSVTIDDSFDFSTANEDDFGALLNISPSDIESIEVLKDASATAIYGTAGGNGVLLIQTKKGAKGKTQFSFSSKFSFKEEPASIPLLNAEQYISMIGDALWNAANAKGVSSSTDKLELMFNTKELLSDPTYKYYKEYNVDTDWLEAVRQNAWSSDNNFSISGGGDKATYRLSLGYLDDIGTTIGTEMARLTAKLRVDYRFNDRLLVYTDFTYTDTQKEANPVENVRSMAQSMMPNQSPYLINDDGSVSSSYFTPESNFQGSFTGISSSNGKDVFNPVAMAKEGYKNSEVREEKMTINLQYDFPFNLRYTGYVSMNMKTTNTDTFVPQVATGVLWSNVYANRSTEDVTDNFTLQTQNKLMYRKVFAEKHSLVVNAMIRTTSSQSASASNTTYANVSTDLSDPAVGSLVASTGSGDSETRKVEMIGSLNYVFDNRYVLNATVNREGNSAMGKDKRFGTFPSIGLSWNFYNEHWLEKADWITEGKIRLSWGMSGNAPTSGYSYLGAYSSLGDYMGISAIYPSRMQLNKLKWETSEEWDYGLDARLFDRFAVTFDYYDKTTRDVLIKKVDTPVTTGYSSLAWMNSGKLSNKGYEIRFDYDFIKTKTWKFTGNINASRNINKVLEIPASYNVEEDGTSYSFGNGNYATRVIKGDPIGSFYGYRYKGVYQNTEETYATDANGNVMRDFNGDVVIMHNGSAQVYPGDAKYEDINHDGVINENDIVYLGNSNPKVTGGAGLALTYMNKQTGNFTLNFLFHGRFGQKVINSARMSLENMHGTSNQSTAVLSRWRKEGDDTDIPRALYGEGYNYLGSDRFVEDASYVRLKTISLTWKMPNKWLKPVGIQSLSWFVTGYDLFTWSGYSGQNPEVSLPTKATSLVKDSSTTPVSKRYAFGFNLNF
jgi:TonB-linked SusC/RagA family outer membrane protein